MAHGAPRRSFVGRAEAYSVREVAVGERRELLHAHIAFIFKDVQTVEMDFTSVSSLLCSQIYLHHNHHLGYEVADDSPRKRKDVEESLGRLQIPLTEIFDIFTSQRAKVLTWLECNSSERNAVMEAVVRIATMQGPRAAAKPQQVPRKWDSLSEERTGCFVPGTEREGPSSTSADELPEEEGSEYKAWFF